MTGTGIPASGRERERARERVVLSLGLDMNNRRARARTRGGSFGASYDAFDGERKNASGLEGMREARCNSKKVNPPPPLPHRLHIKNSRKRLRGVSCARLSVYFGASLKKIRYR